MACQKEVKSNDGQELIKKTSTSSKKTVGFMMRKRKQNKKGSYVFGPPSRGERRWFDPLLIGYSSWLKEEMKILKKCFEVKELHV